MVCRVMCEEVAGGVRRAPPYVVMEEGVGEWGEEPR